MKFIILFIANSYLTKIIPLFIRRERGMCRICYSAAPNEFDVSYKDADKGYIGAAVSGIHEISGRKINALKKKGLRRRPIRQIRITYLRFASMNLSKIALTSRNDDPQSSKTNLKEPFVIVLAHDIFEEEKCAKKNYLTSWQIFCNVLTYVFECIKKSDSCLANVKLQHKDDLAKFLHNWLFYHVWVVLCGTFQIGFLLVFFCYFTTFRIVLQAFSEM